MLRHDQVGGPALRGGYYFFEKRGAEQELWSIYRRKATGGPDELPIDPAPLSADHRTSVGLEGASEDGNLLAYSVRQGGEDETEIHILDVRKRQGLGKRDAGKRLYYHALVPGAANDTEVFGEGFGPDTWIAPVTSENGRYLLIVVQHGWAKGELYFQDLSGSGPPRPGN
jgi:protease II